MTALYREYTKAIFRAILCAALIAVALLGLTYSEASAATIVKSGRKDDCLWSIDSEGLLKLEPYPGTLGVIQGIPEASVNRYYNYWPWINGDYNQKVKSIYIEPGVSVNGSMERMFSLASGYGLLNTLESADLHNLDTSNVTSMKALFNDRRQLINVDCSGWDLRNVTSLEEMFYDCKSLQTINLNGWNTSNVVSTRSMFAGCSALDNPDLSALNTSVVTDMNGMFARCTSLETIDLSNFDTSNVTNMASMFYQCSKLQELDLSNFVTSSVTTMASMFRGCSKLQALDLSNFDTGNVTNMSNMFLSCGELTELDVSNFDTGNVTNMSYMFSWCEKLQELDVSSFDTHNVTKMNIMFNYCRALQELDVSNFDTGNVTTMASMFNHCESLEELNISSFNTANLTTTSSINNFLQGTDKLISVAVGTNTFASEQSHLIRKTGQWERYATLGGMGVYPGDIVNALYDVKNNTAQTPNGWWKPLDAAVPSSGNVEWHFISEEGTQENTWVKSGDGRTWSYTFKVADENQTYYIWEVDPLPDGYVGDFVIGSPAQYNKGENYSEVTITNIKEDFETGGLQISKIMSDGSSDIQFVFHISLLDTEGNGASGVYGDTVVTGGEAVISLAGGESITLSDIPVGYSFTVTEESLPGYTVEPASGTISGSIEADITVSASFTNTPPPPPPTGGFTLSKEVTGRYGESGTYKFLIAFQGLEPLHSYTYLRYLAEGEEAGEGETISTDSEGREFVPVTFAADANGYAYVDVVLGAKGKAVFAGLPEGSSYTITEFAGSNWTASYTVTSDQSVSIGSGSAVAGVDLTTGEEYVEPGENANVIFTNELYKAQNLRLQKWAEDADPERSFDFTIMFSNLEPNTYYNATHWIIDYSDGSEKEAGSFGRFRSDIDGYLEWKVQLKHGDVIIFEGLPVGAMYQITEAACPYIAEYEIWGEDVEIIVDYNDWNEEPDQSLSTEKETVDDGEEITVMFWNDAVELTEVTVKKVWDDEDNLNEVRSPSIKVQLYKDGSMFGEPVTLTAANNGTADNEWSYTWKDLIALESDDVTPIQYTVREEEVIGYDGWNEEPVISGTAEDGYVVTITNKLHEYELKLAKVDQDDNTIGVAGAVFRLYPSSYLKADGSVDTSVEALGKFTSEADENGAPKAISLGKHPVGVYYLIETKAPSKYVKLTSPIKLTILKNGTATMEIQGNSTEATVTTETAETTGTPSASITFTVPNPQGSNLPGVGGSGTQIFYISGFGIVLLAGAMMLLTKKKRGTERIRGNQS